ncbi:hypothetical protein DV738_g4674, partial [Chaetothyriales sp. CBS 135597]
MKSPLFTEVSHGICENLSYWYHPHTSPNELPILFLHGIGVGLFPYMGFLTEINRGRDVKKDGKIGILAVEILPISSRLTSAMFRKDDLCDQLRGVLLRHGFDRFVLMSHSSAVEWFLWYYGSRDIGVAHTLFRTFFWSENILWKEDVLNHRCIVFLGEKDSIVNANKVLAYLRDGEEVDGNKKVAAAVVDGDKNPPETSSPLNVFWCQNLDHGQVFVTPTWRARLKGETLREVKRLDEGKSMQSKVQG